MIEFRHSSIDSTQKLKASYENLYQSKGIHLKDSYYIWLLRLIHPDGDDIFVDVSCGEGSLIYHAMTSGVMAIGIDISLEAIRIARKINPKGQFLVGDGQKLPLPDSKADIVSCIGSLEHFNNPEEGVKEIVRITKPNGIACILLPNTFSLTGNISYALRKGDAFDDGQPIQRYNTKNGWFEFLTNNGLIPYKIYKYERAWPRTMKDLFWYFLRPAKLLHLIATPLIPTNLANCFVYLCHRNN